MAETPQDAAERVMANLEPGQPLADAVERHLNADGGPAPVDEAALARAVASASERIRAKQAPSRRPWALLVLAAVAVLAVGAWFAMPRGEAALDVGPGIQIAEASVRTDGTALVLESGELHFERSARIQPWFDRVSLPHLDIVLVPVGTVFRVTTTEIDATLDVIEGAVEIHVGGDLEGTVRAGEVARLDRSGLVPSVAVVAPDPVADVQPAPGAPPAPGKDPVPHVPIEPDVELPAVLVLLGAASVADLTTEQKVAAIEAANEIGSVRPLVPIAKHLDPQLVQPELTAITWMAIGRDREANGQLAEALVAYERVDDNHWIHPRACLRKGAILHQLGEFDGAKKHLREAIAAGGRTEKAARLALGAVHLADGEPDSAMWAWRKSTLPSASNDAMRVKAQRLNARRMLATWRPELTAVERLSEAETPYQTAVLDPVGATPIVRSRLLAHPELLELAAEHRALESLGATLNTTHDPALTAAHQTALAEHERAGNLATRRALSDLAAEIRRAIPN